MIDIVNLSKILQSQNSTDLEKLVNVISKLENIQNIDDLSQSNLNGKTFEKVLKEVLSNFIEQNGSPQSNAVSEDHNKFSVKNNKEKISSSIKSEQNNVLKNVSKNNQNIRESSSLNKKLPEQFFEIEKGQNIQDVQDSQDIQDTQDIQNNLSLKNIQNNLPLKSIKEIVSKTTEDKENTLENNSKNSINKINKVEKIDEKLKDIDKPLIIEKTEKNVVLPKQNPDNSNNTNNTNNTNTTNNKNNIANVVGNVVGKNNDKDNTTLPNIFQNSSNNTYSSYNPYNSNRNVGNTTAYTNANNVASKSPLTNQLINQRNQIGEIKEINKINKNKEINEFVDGDNSKKQLSKSLLNTLNTTANNTKNNVEYELKTDNAVSKTINLESYKNVTVKVNNSGDFGNLSKVIDGLSIAVLSFTGSVNAKNYSSATNTKDFKLQNTSEKEIKVNNTNTVNIQKPTNNINTALIIEKKVSINEVSEMKSEVKQNSTKSPTARTNQNISQNISQIIPEKLEKSERKSMTFVTVGTAQKNNSPINLSTALDNIIFKIKMPNNVTKNLNNNLNKNLDNDLVKYVVKRIFDENLFEEGSQNSVTDNDLMIILKSISMSITALFTDAISNYIESIGNNKKDYKNLQSLHQMNRFSNTSSVGNIADVANNDSDITLNLSLNSSMNISSSKSRNESGLFNNDNQTSQKQNSVGQFRNDSSELQKNNIEVKSFKIEYREVEKNNSDNQSQKLTNSDEKTEKPKVSNKFIERLAEMTYKGSRNEVVNTTIPDSGKYDLAERLQASRNLENLYEKIREFNLSNKIEERVQMKLLPENLGMLDVEMKKEGRQLTILFLTENEKAKEMLEKNIHILRDRLNNFDMDVRSIEVKVREEEKFYEQDRQQNNNQNSQREEHKHNGNNENKKRFASEGVSDDDDERERNF